MHLDGARVLNAAIYLKKEPHELVKHFDTTTLCLSKGLGAPMGSVIFGSEQDMDKARQLRRILGGGMR